MDSHCRTGALFHEGYTSFWELNLLFRGLAGISYREYEFRRRCRDIQKRIQNRDWLLAEVNKVPDWPESDKALIIGQKAGANKQRCLALFHCGGLEAEIELSADRVSAACAYGGGVYFLIGGELASHPGILRSVLMYVGESKFVNCEEMALARKDASALVIPPAPLKIMPSLNEELVGSQKITICGGFSGKEALRSCVVYHVAAHNYVDLPDLIHGRYGHCLVYLPLARGGGHLYAIGGLAGSPEEYSRSTEYLTYDSDEGPSQNASWKELRPLNVGRAYFGAVVHRCGIFVAGGIGANGSYLSTVEVFQRTHVDGRGQWSLLTSRMNEATPVTGLVLGKKGIVSFGRHGVVEIFSPPGRYEENKVRPYTDWYWTGLSRLTALSTVDGGFPIELTNDDSPAIVRKNFGEVIEYIPPAPGEIVCIGFAPNNMGKTLSAVFDADNDTTRPLTVLPLVGWPEDYSSVIYKSEIFMFGGVELNGEIISNVHAFNVATGAVRTCTSMCLQLARSGAAVIGETWSEEAPIAICGGQSRHYPVLHCQLYRPRTDSYDAMPGMEISRQHLKLAWLPDERQPDRGFLYAIGGSNENCAAMATVECMRMGPHPWRAEGKVTFLTNTWRSIAPMLHGHLGHGVVVHGKRSIIVAGGCANDLYVNTTVECFLRQEDDGGGQWTNLAPMIVPVGECSLLPTTRGYICAARPMILGLLTPADPSKEMDLSTWKWELNIPKPEHLIMCATTCAHVVEAHHRPTQDSHTKRLPSRQQCSLQ